MGASFEANLDRLHAAADKAFGVPVRFRGADGARADLMVEKMAPAPEFSIPGGRARIVAPAIVLMAQIALLPRKPQKPDVFDLLDAAGNVIETLNVVGAASIDDDDGRRYTIRVERA